MAEIWADHLKFQFEEGVWTLLRYDDQPGYRNGIGRLQDKEQNGSGTKAVDLLGLTRSCLFLIELKDFRTPPNEEGSRTIVNKQRFKNLPNEVALKIRDTIAGIVGAAHVDRVDEFKAFLAGLANTKEKISVVLIVDHDLLITPDCGPKLSVLSSQLKAEMRISITSNKVIQAFAKASVLAIIHTSIFKKQNFSTIFYQGLKNTELMIVPDRIIIF